MTVLDDAKRLKDLDPQGMAGLICGFPEMMKKALSIPVETKKATSAGIKNIVFCGMGGSAISADIACRLLSGHVDVPSAVVRGYNLPKFAGKGSLVFVLSYSGNTEETLSCYREALSRGADIIAVTSGGELEKLSAEAGHALVKIPSGLPPRASMPFILVPILRSLEAVFSLTDVIGQIEESILVLEDQRALMAPERPLAENPAKAAARDMFGKFPFILGSDWGSDAAAYRWKCQISENSKVNSCFNVFPELDHNEIVNLASGRSRGVFVVLLRDEEEGQKIQKRIDVTRDVIRNNVGGLLEVYSSGRSILCRILSLCYFGDFVSLYLALLEGEDPMPVKAIDTLKGELAK